MRSLFLLSLVAAVCAAGCAPAARPEAASTPPKPAPATPEASTPGASQPEKSKPETAAKAEPAPAKEARPASSGASDPIVGDWKMAQDQFTLYMQIKADGKTAINLDKTRASLDSLTRQLVEKTAPDPAKKKQAEMVFRTAMDKQIRLLSEYRGTWKRVGDYYQMTSYSSSIDKEPSVTYTRIDDGKLVSTDDKGVPKPGEPPAYRD